MPDATERIGKFEVRVEFQTPTEERRDRQAEALTAWLVAQWEARHKEIEHGAARDAR